MQCAAVTILFALTRVAPQYWPTGDDERLLFRAIIHGTWAVPAVVPPTMLVPGGAVRASAGAGAPAEATASPAAPSAPGKFRFPVMPHTPDCARAADGRGGRLRRRVGRSRCVAQAMGGSPR